MSLNLFLVGEHANLMGEQYIRDVESCPSPTDSYSSEENQGEITPEVEAELLEFASYFY